jgi:stress-induced morphogen
MKRYRLKKEALAFFKEDLATNVMELHAWKENYHVDEKALEEVKPAYVTFGFKENNGSTLSGWSNKDHNREHVGSHFHFTVHFPSTSFQEHDKFAQGRVVRELMDRIQSDLDQFYVKFENETVWDNV